MCRALSFCNTEIYLFIELCYHFCLNITCNLSALRAVELFVTTYKVEKAYQHVTYFFQLGLGQVK